ncbi:MAG TPA: hypothetical protein VGD65_12940, partial [Chryseosolibacter sp.]
QLAYLAKVLMGSKVILNDNVTQVLQFLARHSTTKRSEAISYGSIRGKFYDTETSTKESLRQVLQKMIQHIDKE